MSMLPHKVQENWRVPEYPSLLENWGVILHLLLKSKSEFKLGSSTYFQIKKTFYKMDLQAKKN
jgi:hypothetical protein